MLDFKQRKAFLAKPILADRLLMQQVSPFARALGVELLECTTGRALTRMVSSSRIAIAAEDSRIDPMALLGILDHSAAYALAGLLDAETGLSTLDLRIDFSHDQPAVGEVLVDTVVTMLDDSACTVQSSAVDATETIIATSSGVFRLGAYPGNVAPRFELMGGYDPAQRVGPYRHTLGLQRENGQLILAADNKAIIGWESGNALHGGAIAGLLMAACKALVGSESDTLAQQRLASLGLRFIRPGSGARPLLSVAEFERRGRAASFVSACCYHEQGRDIARAQATFVS